MIEKTKVSPANTAKSLRTTIPMSVVKMFELTKDSRLIWDIDVNNGIKVTIRKDV